ncbi:hypothetical protein AgCh_008243 [Apium graveolens]
MSLNKYESIKIPILRKAEYPTWKVKMLMHLEATDPDYLDVINDGPYKPTKSVPATPTVDEHLQLKEKTYKTFKEIWDALETQYQGTTTIKKNIRVVLVQEYEHFEAKTDESLTDIYDRFLTLLNDLSLVEKVKSQKNRSSRKKFTGGERKPSGRREGKDLKAGKVDRSKIKCYNYDEPGHFATECIKSRNDKGKNKVLITSSKDWMDSTDSENEGTKYALMASFDNHVSLDSKGNRKNTLILDSGCSGHMTGNKSLMSEFEKKAGPDVSYGDGNVGHILGYGNLIIGKVAIENVALVEGLTHNLLSISQITNRGYYVVFYDSNYEVVHNKSKKIVFMGYRHGNMKDETPEILLDHIRKIENGSTHKVKILRSDNGTEFKNSKMEESFISINISFDDKKIPGFEENSHESLIFANKNALLECGSNSNELSNPDNPNPDTPDSEDDHCTNEPAHVEGEQQQEGHDSSPKTSSGDNSTDLGGVSNAFDEAYNLGGTSSSRRTLPSARKGTKDHTPDLIIGNPNEGVKIRSATQNECLYHNLLSKEEPKNVEDALKDADWVIAMQEELNEFERNEVWKLVPRPKNRSIMGTKWVFRNKTDSDGTIVINKARLVAKGYSQ